MCVVPEFSFLLINCCCSFDSFSLRLFLHSFLTHISAIFYFKINFHGILVVDAILSSLGFFSRFISSVHRFVCIRKARNSPGGGLVFEYILPFKNFLFLLLHIDINVLLSVLLFSFICIFLFSFVFVLVVCVDCHWRNQYHHHHHHNHHHLGPGFGFFFLPGLLLLLLWFRDLLIGVAAYLRDCFINGASMGCPSLPLTKRPLYFRSPILNAI